MLRNYLKIVFRLIARNRSFSVINISGLAIGLTCCTLIFLYVSDELRYDRFQSNYDNTYRIIYHTTNGYDLAQIPPPINQHLTTVNPEVEYASRVYQRNASVRVGESAADEKIFEENFVTFADSSLSQIFDFEFIEGNPNLMLKSEFQVYLSEETSEKYFGNEPALGKTIFLVGDHPFQVAGVFKDYPEQSHIHFNLIMPYENMFDVEPQALQQVMRDNLAMNWVISHSANYVKLKEGADPEAVDARFDEMINTYAPEQLRMGQVFDLQPLSRIHLYSADISLNPEAQGDISVVVTFSTIAIITLIIAIFNFINLSTAQSVNRAQEVGVRKVMGAGRKLLFAQFMGESAIITLIAFLLAIPLVLVALPYLNSITEKDILGSAMFQPNIFFGLVVLYLLTVFLGGCFPALIISRIKLSNVLKGKLSSTEKKVSLRKVLIAFQMAISVVLISGAFIVYNQIQYMTNRSMGFVTETIITVPLFSQNLNAVFGGVDDKMRSRLNAFEDKMLSYPEVESVTLANNVPGMGVVSRNFSYEGMPEEDVEFIASFSVDYDFVQTMELELLAGRNFDPAAGSDHLQSFIINEKAVQRYGWETPENAIGKEVNLEGKSGAIIGVVKDFHFVGFRSEIRPMLLDVGVPLFNSCIIKVNPGASTAIVDQIENEWNDFFPQKSFEYTWLDERIESTYQAEDRLSKVITTFSILAIIVSAMGAYGLIMFMANQREKEIGIRKVLGASTIKLVFMMFKEFTILFIIGALIAVPLIFKFGNDWLNEFTYHIPISIDLFLSGMIATIMIVWISISFQSIRAATKNPVNCLRDE